MLLSLNIFIFYIFVVSVINFELVRFAISFVIICLSFFKQISLFKYNYV